MPESTLPSATEHVLDITADVCPLTFVRAKLLIEKMAPGERARIRLRGREPLANVPRSVAAMGHEIVSLAPEDAAGAADAVHILVIRKRGAAA